MSNEIFAAFVAVVSVIFGFFSGKTKEENKKLNEEARGVRVSRKVEKTNRGLSRDRLIDKL